MCEQFPSIILNGVTCYTGELINKLIELIYSILNSQ